MCPQKGQELIKESKEVDDLSHRAMRFTNFGVWTIKGLKVIFFIPVTFIGSTQHKWVKRPGSEYDRSFSPIVDVMNEWSSACPPPPYAIRAWTGEDLPYLCRSSIPNLLQKEKKCGITGRNSLTPLSNAQTLLHQFL
jgi:hypothetical protein